MPGRFRRRSGRALFSVEGGFTFSKAPFEGTLHEGLKEASPSEGFKETSRGLEGGLKGAQRRLKGDFMRASPSKASRGLEGSLKGA